VAKWNLGRVKGNVWYTGSSYVGIEHPLHGDMFLNSKTSVVYQYQENIGWVKITETITTPSEYYSREQIDEIIASLVSRIEKLENNQGSGEDTTNISFVDENGNQSTLIFVDENGNESQIIFEEE
jgi:hypothetical protein